MKDDEVRGYIAFIACCGLIDSERKISTAQMSSIIPFLCTASISIGLTKLLRAVQLEDSRISGPPASEGKS